MAIAASHRRIHERPFRYPDGLDAIDEHLAAGQQEGAVPAARARRARRIGPAGEGRSPPASADAREARLDRVRRRRRASPTRRSTGLDRVVGYFARLAAPIDFQAVDELPVDLVFLLFSPPDAGAEHLKALAARVAALRDRSFVAKLRGAGSRDAIYALLAGDRKPRCRLRAIRRTPRVRGPGRAFPRARIALRRGADQPAVRIAARDRRARRRAHPLPDRARLFHAGGAAHGTIYFKMIDDAAFYACNSLVTDRFLLTTAFNLLFTRPLARRRRWSPRAAGSAASAACSSARRG